MGSPKFAITEDYTETLNRSLKIAAENGVSLTSDEERKNKIIGLLTKAFTTRKTYSCPCKSDHPICPCDSMMDEIEADGECRCRLFGNY